MPSLVESKHFLTSEKFVNQLNLRKLVFARIPPVCADQLCLRVDCNLVRETIGFSRDYNKRGVNQLHIIGSVYTWE